MDIIDEYVLSKAWQLFRQKKINSAIVELEKNKKNSFYKIDYLLFDSEKLLADGNFDDAEKNYKIAIKNANEKEYKQGLGYAYLKLSEISYKKGKFDDALKNAKISLNFFENNKIPIEEGKLDINNIIGLIHYSQGQYNEAAIFFNRTLEIAKSLDILIDTIRALNNLGIILQLQGFYSKALQYYIDASEYSLKSDEAAYTRANLFNNIADLELIQGFYSKAEKNFLRALEFTRKQKIENKRSIEEGVIHNNLGSLYSQRGEFNKAENEFSVGIELFTKMGLKINLPVVKGLLAEHYRRKGDFENAIKNFKESISLYEELSIKDSYYQNVLCKYVELLIIMKKEDEAFHYISIAQKIAQRKNSSQIEKARVELQLSKVALDKGNINLGIFLIDEYVLPVAEDEYSFSTMINAYLTKTEALLYKYKLKNDEKSLLDAKQTMAKLIDLTYKKGLFPEYIRAQFLNSVLLSTTPEGKEEGKNILQEAISLAEKYGIMNLEYLGKNIAEELANREELLTKSEMVNVFERNIKTISYRMFLTDDAQVLLNESSMILIGQDSSGPNIFSKENADDYTSELLFKLATFTAIAIGQGDSYNKGLFGPMPVPNKKEYLTLLYSFSIKDKTLLDQRYKGKNYVLIAFLVHTDVIHFFYDRMVIKKVFDDSLLNVSSIKDITTEVLASIRNKLLSSCVPKWRTSTSYISSSE